MYLMLKDIKVLYFDFDEFIVQEINKKLLPYGLRGAFTENISIKSLMHNVQVLKTWLSRRVLSLNRDNAKSLYIAFGIPQMDDVETRVKICLACKGVSIQDSYWIKNDEFMEFNDVNIRHKHFKELFDISLIGNQPTVSENINNPELTTHGVFRKCWTRQDNDLYILKSDSHINNINTRMEVLASKVISCLNGCADIVSYTGRVMNTKAGKIYVDKSKNFVNDKYSFVEAYEVMEYCIRNVIDFKKDVLGYNYKSSSIGVIDYIVLNTDRHSQNYGFMMDNETGELVGLAPLFDFNCALVADVFNRKAEDTLSQMFIPYDRTKETLRSICNKYKPYVKIQVDKDKLKYIEKSNLEYKDVFKGIYRRLSEIELI